MPRISAGSVIEHRENQRELLLSAARDLLVTQGPASVTPGSVAGKSGLSRPAVYQYFENASALIEQVVREDFEESNLQMDQALAGLLDPKARAHAYIESVIRQAAAGMHRTATALTGWNLPTGFKAEVDRLHREQTLPLQIALRELGLTDHIQMALIGGLVETGLRLAEAGVPAPAVTEAICSQLEAALSRQ